MVRRKRDYYQGTHGKSVISVGLGRMGKIGVFYLRKFMLRSSIDLTKTDSLELASPQISSYPVSVIESYHLCLLPLSYSHPLLFIPQDLAWLITSTTGMVCCLNVHLLSCIPSTQAILTTMTIVDCLFAAVMLKKCLSVSVTYMI